MIVQSKNKIGSFQPPLSSSPAVKLKPMDLAGIVLLFLPVLGKVDHLEKSARAKNARGSKGKSCGRPVLDVDKMRMKVSELTVVKFLTCYSFA